MVFHRVGYVGDVIHKKLCQSIVTFLFFWSAIECVAFVCNKYNVKLSRVDYNKAWDGKDEYDRKFSLLKTAMRYFRDEGNDILCANDMMDAIINRCTNQQIKCCVIQIDNKKTTTKNFTKIQKNFNIYSIEIVTGSLRVWNYFNIGDGKLIPLKNCYNL